VLVWERIVALDDPSSADSPDRLERLGGQSMERALALPDPDAREHAYTDLRTRTEVHSDPVQVDRGQPAQVGERAYPDQGEPVRPERSEPAQAECDDDKPEATQSQYWDEVPRLVEAWSELKNEWPEHCESAAAADRSEDPLGSFRSDGGAYLDPEQNDQVTEEIGRVRETEAQVSDDVRTIERENSAGAWLEGFECRLKGDDRLKEKVAEKLKDQGDRPPQDIVREVPDAIRYTFCAQTERYAEGYHDLKDRFESFGYEMYQCKNLWKDPEYKGINTRWMTPEGRRFEVQFHTSESFHAKQHVTHEAYERARNPLTSRAELAGIERFQREVSSRIPAPDSAADIDEFKKKGF
jgi:hypothetical protein